MGKKVESLWFNTPNPRVRGCAQSYPQILGITLWTRGVRSEESNMGFVGLHAIGLKTQFFSCLKSATYKCLPRGAKIVISSCHLCISQDCQTQNWPKIKSFFVLPAAPRMRQCNRNLRCNFNIFTKCRFTKQFSKFSTVFVDNFVENTTATSAAYTNNVYL